MYFCACLFFSFFFFFYPLLPRSSVFLCRPTEVEMFEPRRLGSLGWGMNECGLKGQIAAAYVRAKVAGTRRGLRLREGTRVSMCHETKREEVARIRMHPCMWTKTLVLKTPPASFIFKTFIFGGNFIFKVNVAVVCFAHFKDDIVAFCTRIHWFCFLLYSSVQLVNSMYPVTFLYFNFVSDYHWIVQLLCKV